MAHVALLNADGSPRTEEQLAATMREQVMDNPERHTVNFSFSLHSMRKVDEGMQLHLVLKFRYAAELIERVMGAARPEKDYLHEFGTAARLFPFCIFNSVEESPISWTYQNEGGKVYERVELTATLTYVSYTKYFPFVLQLLPIKIGSDGTGKTGLINLVPDTLSGSSVPNADMGVFTKSTSDFSIGGADAATIADKVVCRMFIRDLTEKAVGNISGIYTRVYVTIFFEQGVVVNFTRYIVVPTLMIQMCTFLTVMEVGDIVQTILAMVIANTALLFVLPLPGHSDVTLAEEIILGQLIYCVGTGCAISALSHHELLEDHPAAHCHWVANADLVVAIVTVAWTIRGFYKFKKLTQAIREKFNPICQDFNVGSFNLVDAEI